MVGSVGRSKLDLPTDHYYSTMQGMTSADCIRRTACYQTYASLSSRRCLSIRSSLLPWVVGRAVVPHPASIRCCCDKLMSFSSVIRQSFHPIAAWSPPVRSSSPVYTRRLQLLQPPLFPFRPGLKADVQTTGRSINRSIGFRSLRYQWQKISCVCVGACVGGIHCRREPQTYQQRIHALI